MDIASFATALGTKISGITYLGEELVNGTPTNHIQGTIPSRVVSFKSRQ